MRSGGEVRYECMQHASMWCVVCEGRASGISGVEICIYLQLVILELSTVVVIHCDGV